MQSGIELGMVGTTYRRAGQGGLAYFTLSPDELADPAWARDFAQACGVAECVYLATCNRVELFFAAAPGHDVADCRRRIFAYFAARPGAAASPLADARQLHAFAGEGAVERLFVVASALDAMVPGEAQVLGQVKAAYAHAAQVGLAGARLRPVFAAAFAAAKQVRQLSALGQGSTSMLSLVMDLIDDRVAQVRGRPAQVVVVGAGDMAEQCARVLKGRDDVALVFVNRTLGRALDLAGRSGGRAISLADYLRAPLATDLLLTATAAPEALFGAAFFAALPPAGPTSMAPLVIDLAVPRDVEPEAALGHGAALYDVDRMQAVAQRHVDGRRAAVAQARSVLDDALDAYRRELAERSMGGAIAAVRAQGQALVQAHLDAFKGALPPAVPAAAVPDIERLARAVWRQLAHRTTRGLKALAHAHGAEALESYLRGSGIDATAAAPFGQAGKNNQELS